jgi:hypothetical protein
VSARIVSSLYSDLKDYLKFIVKPQLFLVMDFYLPTKAGLEIAEGKVKVRIYYLKTLLSI